VTVQGGYGNFSSEIEIGPLHLSAGYHNITLQAASGKPMFNMAKLSDEANKSTLQFHNSLQADIPSYRMNSGSEYKINPTADYVAFLEAGNGYWNLNGPNGVTDSICIFNYGSLFPIDSKGSEYTLRYIGLSYVEQGFLVAVVGTVLMAVALKFLYPKRYLQRKPEP